MNKRLFTIILLSLLLTTSRGIALAENDGKDAARFESKSEMSETSDDPDENSDVNEVESAEVEELEAEDTEDEFDISVSPSPSPSAGGFSFSPASESSSHLPKIQINKSNFEIIGSIDSISGNTMVVAGQTIIIDISKVKNFENKGVLAVGETVKVGGPIVNGQKFAKQIIVFGSGGQTLKIEIKNTPTGAEIEARGPLDQILFFLKQILGIT